MSIENVREDNVEHSNENLLLDPIKLDHKISLDSIVCNTIGSTLCRICQTNTVNEDLISPCNCKGSLAYVHYSCLERWLNQSCRNYCELCMYQYEVIETQRYSLCEAILLWIRHPASRTQLQTDLLIATVLTLLTIGVIVVSWHGMEYMAVEVNKMGISRMWVHGFLFTLLTIVIAGYSIIIYLLARDNIKLFYTWWKNMVDVKLLIPSTICLASRVNSSAC